MKKQKQKNKPLSFLHLKLGLTKLSLLILLVFTATNSLILGLSRAFMLDQEVVSGEINTTNLDFTLRSLAFSSADPLLAGQQIKRSVFVQKVGNLPFQYSQSYQFLSGDTDLCSNLQLKVDYQYYNAGGILQTVNKYNGSLTSFDLNSDGSDPDLVLPNAHSYQTNGDYGSNEHWFVYDVSLPVGSDEALQNLNCNYNLIFRSWQEGLAAYPQGFHDEEILANTVSSGTWYLPPPTILGWDLPEETSLRSLAATEPAPDLKCGEVTNGVTPGDPQIASLWSDVGVSDVRYQRKVTYPDGSSQSDFYETSNSTDFSFFDSKSDQEGVWSTQVRAFIDKNGNNQADEGVDLISAWSKSCDVILDITAPTTAATVTNSPTRPIEERLTNGGFESGDLNGWTKDEEAQVEVIGADDFTQPYEGKKMAKLGVTSDLGNPVAINILSQPIAKGVRSVGFYYNFFTKDVAPFDEPGMMVFVNEKQVQQIWAKDVKLVTHPDGSRSTGWQPMNIYIGDVPEATITIAFYAGNTANAEFQSWLYLDKVSTLDMVVNDKAIFDLKVATQPLHSAAVKTYYQIGENGTAQPGDSFNITTQPDQGLIKYWSEDEAGNIENPHEFWLAYDVTPPTAISDLKVTDTDDGDYELKFTAPSDDLFPAVNEYDIRYSATPITATSNWDILPKATLMKLDTLPGDSRAPRYAGEAETKVVTNLDEGKHYYFAIKSADAAKNWSAISNIVESNTDAAVSSEIVLNEIMFNPIGDDNGSMPAGEWVELFNNSENNIDVAGWTIKNSIGKTMTISSTNSDNDLDADQPGETMMPAGERLVVYVNGAGILANTGDTVTLFDESDQVVDSHAYLVPEIKAEGLTEARIPDGVGEWVDPLATPGTPWSETAAGLMPQVRFWQQADNNGKVIIFDAQDYQQANYVVTYSHQFDQQLVREAIQGQVEINQQGRIEINKLYFGTCSEDGKVCPPHVSITDIQVEVELSRADGTTQVIKYDYPHPWIGGI